MKPPIFIFGVPRSGTTLLRTILNCHPHIACGPEAPWLANHLPQSVMAMQEMLVHGQHSYCEGFQVPAGEVYSAIESPRGELGCYIVADGGSKPYRIHVRAPSFVNMQAVPLLMRGGTVSDAITVISSVDPIMGEVDR